MKRIIVVYVHNRTRTPSVVGSIEFATSEAVDEFLIERCKTEAWAKLCANSKGNNPFDCFPTLHNIIELHDKSPES